MQTQKIPNTKNGFTLVELLVVMAIIGVLAALGLGGFVISQIRGRDAERKSDLKQLAQALELYYSDYNSYPDALAGQIVGCPSTTNGPCAWGTGEFTDTNTVYFKKIPKDPASSQNYFYRVSADGKKFQLYAHLENTEDKNCLPDGTGEPNCTSPTLPGGESCGVATCNFSITSQNTTPSESI